MAGLKKYKILVVLANEEMLYLGEHLLPEKDDVWQWMGKVVDSKVDASHGEVIATRGYREDMPYYANIVDSTSFYSIAFDNLTSGDLNVQQATNQAR